VDHRDVVGQGIGIVRWVVDDSGCCMGYSTGCTAVGSYNADCVSGSPSDGAVSSRSDPAVVDDESTAEVSVTG
jgi:hypothetical protein